MSDASKMPVLYVLYADGKLLQYGKSEDKAQLIAQVQGSFPTRRIEAVPANEANLEDIAKLSLALLAEWLIMQFSFVQAQRPGSKIIDPRSVRPS